MPSFQKAPMTIFTPEGTRRFPATNCNSRDGDSNTLYPLVRRPKMFFFRINRLESLDLILGSLNQTVTNCPNIILPGYYHYPNSFFFQFGPAESNGLSRLKEKLFADKQVRRHGRVLALSHTGISKGLNLHAFNFYKSTVVHVGVWKHTLQGTLNLFPQFSMQV